MPASPHDTGAAAAAVAAANKALKHADEALAGAIANNALLAALVKTLTPILKNMAVQENGFPKATDLGGDVIDEALREIQKSLQNATADARPIGEQAMKFIRDSSGRGTMV
jgi:hypothetical protein